MTHTPLYRRNVDPLKMASYLLITIGVVSFFGSLMGGQSEEPNFFPYLIATSFTLLFALFNSILLINAEDSHRYWVRSMLGFVLLILGGIGMSYLITGIFVTKADSYYAIYSVVTVGYFVFLSIAGLIKFLLAWAQRMDR